MFEIIKKYLMSIEGIPDKPLFKIIINRGKNLFQQDSFKRLLIYLTFESTINEIIHNK